MFGTQSRTRITNYDISVILLIYQDEFIRRVRKTAIYVSVRQRLGVTGVMLGLGLGSYNDNIIGYG
jgi:hypothetical protein